MSLPKKRLEKHTLGNVLLVGDIGGTNARFALTDVESKGYRDERVLRSAEYESAEHAIRHYLTLVDSTSPDIVCLAAAGPVRQGCVDLTNNPWRVRVVDLYRTLDAREVRLLNDFEAIACGLPELDESDCAVIGIHPVQNLLDNDYTVGVIGPGTGLGAAGLIKRGDLTLPLLSEAGHVGFAPENDLQRAVWEIVRRKFGRVSDERLISGNGLENIFSALAEIHDVHGPGLSASEIFEAVNSDPVARESVNLFFEILGQIAGNFALSLGAYQGIYIAGGIVQRYPDMLMNSSFRASFENKGRHRHLMEDVPTFLITHPEPGLLGAAAIARQLALECV